jgi:hypothetical protein
MSEELNRGWTEAADIAQAFQVEEGEVSQYEILYGEYWCDSYEGSAYFLLRKDGKLYEVEGRHCSCNGLEGQWSPHEVVLEQLKDGKRKPFGISATALQKVVDAL